MDDELEIARAVTGRVCDLTKRYYGRRLVATGPLVRAIHMLRLFRILFPDRNSIIFEVGPGSGYVGALLVADGYAYASTDIAQAFYLSSLSG